MLLVDSDGIPPMSCDDKGCPMAARKYTNAVPEIMRHGAVEPQNQRLATGRFGGCLASRANRCPVQRRPNNRDRFVGSGLPHNPDAFRGTPKGRSRPSYKAPPQITAAAFFYGAEARGKAIVFPKPVEVTYGKL